LSRNVFVAVIDLPYRRRDPAGAEETMNARRNLHTTTRRGLLLSSLVLLALAAVGCKRASAASGPINGAGSTFINPLMSRWSSEYQRIDPSSRINYQSIGSGGGIRQLIARTVQFGATDGPMTDQQLHEAHSPVVHIPVVMGAVVPTYNLEGVTQTLRFSPEVLAAIFLGQITTWNDPRIAADNPGVALPATSLVVVHRSDGSGTTYIFTDYLSKISPEWQTRVGRATSVNWPVGLGGRGNEGIAGTVRNTPGSIGYVELTYALQNNMPAGIVRNHDGQFVAPSIAAVTAAASASTGNLPADLRYSITDAPGAASWPISGTVWILLYQDMPEGAPRHALVSFVRWALHDGQRFCDSLHYAPLPAALVALAEAKLNAIEPPGAR
jgi:phosphate transport system substrate-binding protein